MTTFSGIRARNQVGNASPGTLATATNGEIADDVSVEGHDTEGQEPDHRKIEVLIQRGEYDYGKHWSQEDNSDTCDGLSDVSEMTDKFLDVDDGGAKSERPVIGSPPKKSSHSKAGRKSAPPCSSSQAALTWTPAKGAAGQQITFAFCYATRGKPLACPLYNMLTYSSRLPRD